MSRERPGSRRNQPRRSGRSFPYLWVVTGLIVAAVIGFIYYASRQSTVAAETVECNKNEFSTYHVHANLKIYVNGQNVPVPASVGIRQDCLYWLHTHDASGTIHIEAPQARNYTLGQFFKIWEKTLSPTEMMGYQTDDAHQIKAWVNGEEFTGDPATIPLKSHSVMTLEYGPPFPPPQPFQFQPNE